MHVTIVHVKVKAEHVSEFLEATRENHVGSVQEPENMRFDVLQLGSDPTHFVLYEAYGSAEAAAAHKKTPHYLKWRERVEPWMAEPRCGVNYNGVFPQH